MKFRKSTEVESILLILSMSLLRVYLYVSLSLYLYLHIYIYIHMPIYFSLCRRTWRMSAVVRAEANIIQLMYINKVYRCVCVCIYIYIYMYFFFFRFLFLFFFSFSFHQNTNFAPSFAPRPTGAAKERSCCSHTSSLAS